jgi:hypothetical protein
MLHLAGIMVQPQRVITLNAIYSENLIVKQIADTDNKGVKIGRQRNLVNFCCHNTVCCIEISIMINDVSIDILFTSFQSYKCKIPIAYRSQYHRGPCLRHP